MCHVGGWGFDGGGFIDLSPLKLFKTVEDYLHFVHRVHGLTQGLTVSGTKFPFFFSYLPQMLKRCRVALKQF